MTQLPTAGRAHRLQPIVIWFGRVGDMVLLSTLLDILHRRYGRPCRIIGAGTWTAELYQTHRDVAEVWCLRRYAPPLLDAAWWRTLWALRQSDSDPIYVCEYNPRRLAGIRRLLTLSGVDRGRCVFLTEQPGCAQPHWIDRLISLGRLTPPALSESSYPWPSISPLCAPRLEVAPAARTECRAWLEQRGWSDRPIVLVQPGNRRTMRGSKLRVSATDDKAWPIERWAELLHRVHACMPEAVILLCGAPRETLLLGWIWAATNLDSVVAAELPLGRLLALCERAHSMISVDTGPAHAAAALGLPLVVLFGGNSQAEWLPRSAVGSAVVGLGGPPLSKRLDEISVARVFESWRALVTRDSSSRACQAPETVDPISRGASVLERTAE